MKYIKLLIILISCLIGGFQIGKTSFKKGYLNGIILGSIIIFIFLLFSIFLNSLKISTLIYYFIILIATTLGSILGINKKKT